MHRTTTLTVFLSAGAVLLSNITSAQCQAGKLAGSDVVSREFFGASLATSGPRLLVGASYGDLGKGSAYVFDMTPNGWVESAKLVASDGAQFDYFGQAVALSGDTAVIGARGAGADDRGAVYVFEKGTQGWVEAAKLTASDSAPADAFGISVAVDGGIVAVGMPNDDVENAHNVLKENVGSVRVFERTPSGWTETAMLVPSDLDATHNSQYDRFGSSVALDQGRLLVGASGDEGTGSTDNTGSVYFFDRTPTGWVEAVKIPGDAPAGQFGYRVALDEDVAVVGARLESLVGQPHLGAAYVFERETSGWSLVSRLEHPDPMPGDGFGAAVALSGGTVLVGVQLDDELGDSSGSAFVFERTSIGWEETRRLVAADGGAGDSFGASLAIADGLALVGAYGDDEAGNDSGAVYSIDLSAPGQASGYCVGAPNSAGPGAAVSQVGSLAVGGNQFAVRVVGAVPGESATLFYGATQVQVPFGDGTLCVASPVFRVGPIQSLSADGSTTFPVDFLQPPAHSGPGMIAPGATWNFQVWYRDPAAGGAGFNLSDALNVTFCP